MLTRPLGYYAQRDALDLSQAGAMQELAGNDIERVAFVCREPRCFVLDTLVESYRIFRSGSVQWNTRANPVNVYERARSLRGLVKAVRPSSNEPFEPVRPHHMQNIL
jgi:hypothetical protein